MAILSAQNNFNRGLAAMLDDNFRDAAVFFHRAMEIEKQRSVRQPEMRYLSYYGLCLAKVCPTDPEAVEACRRAATSGSLDPDLFLNLGRVHLLQGKIAPALRAFHRGIEIAPKHPILLRELSRVERRRAPFFASLHRDHPLNQWLGRMQAALRLRGVRRRRAALRQARRSRSGTRLVSQQQ